MTENKDQYFVNPQNITYGHSSYYGFDVRSVYVNNNLKGEFHIKPSDEVELNNLVDVLKNISGEGYEIALVDSTGSLNLDFPIYLVIKNPILIDTIEAVWFGVENFLKD